jgi:hypothetical protein
MILIVQNMTGARFNSGILSVCPVEGHHHDKKSSEFKTG